LLDARENQIFPLRFQRKYYTSAGNTQSFGIYKWEVTAQAGQNQTVFQVAEWELFGQETGPFNPPTGIAGTMVEDNCRLYPNPAADWAVVQGTREGETVEVFDLSGRKCLEVSGQEGSTLLPASLLQPGNYVVRFGNIRLKLIK
ncbi:MAG: T9SS type A sorting domain-containing protein, partial [Paludibacteraceae bacterium]|nr:T9SS type A sorting domain-containing protein [Paludibacteraceae bacterium]